MKEKIDRAIIIAAGMGSRILPITEYRPKCMIEVQSKSILNRAIDSLKKSGINDIAIVKGYFGHLMDGLDCRFFENLDYQDNNILQSLFKAEEFMDKGFISSYSDIIFSSKVVSKLVNHPGDIVVTVDRSWKSAYEGRTQHPYSEAEVVYDKNEIIQHIGKGSIDISEATGEFIGLTKFSVQGAKIWKYFFSKNKEIYKDQPNLPFVRGKTFQKSYLTDLFQDLVNHGIKVEVSSIDGGWMEIDTQQDLERAEKIAHLLE